MAKKSAETEQTQPKRNNAGHRGNGKAQKDESELKDERYRRNRPGILSRKLVRRVKSGSLPWRSTVQKYGADPTELFKSLPEDKQTDQKVKKRFAKMGADVESQRDSE